MTDRSKNEPPAEAPEGERIAKVMARAGLCSRRDAERWIADGRVSVNGRVLDSPAFNVTERDQVTVDGRPIARRERTRLFLFHKPRGTVTTDHDPEGRQTTFDVLPEGLPRLVTIGRLDINTEGLLLLTNDGGLARVLELPATGWLRRYRVRAHGEIDQAQLDALAGGLVIEGVEYRGIEAKIDRVQGANVWITMGLREGKNREIKRVLEHLGLAVNRLIRVSYGPFQLGDLDEGAIEEVKTRILKDQLGENLSAEAGADFEAPVLDTKDREKIARRHPREERPLREAPARESAERGGERYQRRPGRAGRPGDRDARGDERALSARDVAGRSRKHVSVIRSERAQADGEGRRRIERSETADRRGRPVPVERVSGGERDAQRAGNRNARRFTRERTGGEGRADGRPERKPSGGGAWRRSDAPGERPARDGKGRGPGRNEDRRQDRGPARNDERGERRWAPRGEGRAAGGGDRPPRRERTRDEGQFERAPRESRGAGPGRGPRKEFGDRPPRREGGERPPRKEFGERPPRRDFAGERPARSFDDKPGGQGRPGKGAGFRGGARSEAPARGRGPAEAGRRERGPAEAGRPGRPPGRGRDGGAGAPSGKGPGAGFGKRPGGGPGARFGGKPGGKPGGRPGDRPGGRPGGKPRGKPGGKPGGSRGAR